ncbi:MAG TPA: acetate--CoA ligase family protein, partial [Methylocella sp.]|nr:acetate--CoA ligase family protein [Methylocella sp.]
NRDKLSAAGIPCHEWPIAAASVLAATRAAPARPLADQSKLQPVPMPGAASEAGWLASHAAFSLLQQAGFPVARWAIANDPDGAVAAACGLGFPVVLKAERPGLVHKSEANAVRLGLCDGNAVAQAFEDFSRSLGPGPALVQEQAGPGVELFIGARRDPAFGPVVMAGLGGIWIEALGDTALRLAPIEEDEALLMLGELKGRKALSGLRGKAPVCMARFAGLAARVSQWFAAAAWLGELDLNPVIASGKDFTIADARMRIASHSITT